VQKEGMKEKQMALDVRLACLMTAIREDWEELEVEEVDGQLVIRVKKA
jgi:hypothetical protein